MPCSRRASEPALDQRIAGDAIVTDSLIVPVYLNQSVVFDLVAMMQGGLATVTRINSVASDESRDASKLEGRFGLGGALATLFKVGFSGEGSSDTRSTSQTNTASERVHTPSSLFYELRRDIRKSNQLKELVGDSAVVSGDIVEFKALLRPNPVLQVVMRMAAVMDVMGVFQESPDHNKMSSKKGHPESANAKTGRQLSQFLEKLKTGGTVDIITEPIVMGARAVITLEEKYLNDPSMADLLDGEFSILGKVIRVIERDEDSISLLRKTAFNAMPDRTVDETLEKVALSAGTALAIPKLEWRISAPALHVLPVAIFA